MEAIMKAFEKLAKREERKKENQARQVGHRRSTVEEDHHDHEDLKESPVNVCLVLLFHNKHLHC